MVASCIPSHFFCSPRFSYSALVWHWTVWMTYAVAAAAGVAAMAIRRGDSVPLGNQAFIKAYL